MELTRFVLINNISQKVQFRGDKIGCNNERKRLNKIFGKNSFSVEKRTDLEWRLCCTFINKEYKRNGITSYDTKGDSYVYRAATKKQCIERAKAAYRYSRNYLKEWDIVETD